MKKAQIKMGETIAVLVIFFFLVVFGMTFYTRMQSASFSRMADREANLKAVQVSQKVSFIPELQCSFRNIQVDNCFDITKIKVFNSSLENDPEGMKLYYYDMFEYSTIKVKQVYPQSDEVYDIYSLVPDTYTRRLQTQIPVSLYDSASGNYIMGVVYVDFYGQ